MPEIRRLQGREQESLLELYAVITMAHGLEPLRRRLKTIPNGMRTLGQLRWASRKLLDDVMATIPTEQLVRRNGIWSIWAIRSGCSAPTGNRARKADAGFRTNVRWS